MRMTNVDWAGVRLISFAPVLPWSGNGLQYQYVDRQSPNVLEIDRDDVELVCRMVAICGHGRAVNSMTDRLLDIYHLMLAGV